MATHEQVGYNGNGPSFPTVPIDDPLIPCDPYSSDSDDENPILRTIHEMAYTNTVKEVEGKQIDQMRKLRDELKDRSNYKRCKFVDSRDCSRCEKHARPALKTGNPVGYCKKHQQYMRRKDKLKNLSQYLSSDSSSSGSKSSSSSSRSSRSGSPSRRKTPPMTPIDLSSPPSPDHEDQDEHLLARVKKVHPNANIERVEKEVATSNLKLDPFEEALARAWGIFAKSVKLPEDPNEVMQMYWNFRSKFEDRAAWKKPAPPTVQPSSNSSTAPSGYQSFSSPEINEMIADAMQEE